MRYLTALLDRHAVSIFYEFTPDHILEHAKQLAHSAKEKQWLTSLATDWVQAECAVRLATLQAMKTQSDSAHADDILQATEHLADAQRRAKSAEDLLSNRTLPAATGTASDLVKITGKNTSLESLPQSLQEPTSSSALGLSTPPTTEDVQLGEVNPRPPTMPIGDPSSASPGPTHTVPSSSSPGVDEEATSKSTADATPNETVGVSQKLGFRWYEVALKYARLSTRWSHWKNRVSVRMMS